jgi:hypothetical protein
MWCDRELRDRPDAYTVARPYLRFGHGLWHDLVRRMAEVGLNMVVIDLGEGVRYQSHPELAVKGSWTRKQLQKELQKLRAMGLEPIPKLNFSTCHDAWLGPYARMVSTETYYRVCRDLIGEVMDLFGGPRLFHLGMDEETAGHQRNFAYAVMRQHELWWHDFLFLVDQVERRGARAWIWSDYVWHNPGAFFKNMPKRVLQSNWYYGASFSKKLVYVQAYLDLEKHGYDQVPTGSNWSTDLNFQRTVWFCNRHIAAKRLKGFLHAPWHPTLEAKRQHLMTAVDQASEALAKWEYARRKADHG